MSIDINMNGYKYFACTWEYAYGYVAIEKWLATSLASYLPSQYWQKWLQTVLYLNCKYDYSYTANEMRFATSLCNNLC